MNNDQIQPFSPYQKLVMFILVMAQFSVFLDFSVMSPLGDILMKTMSLKPDRFGIVVSAYAFSACVSGFLTAGFADRFDRKKMLLFFYIGFIAGTVFCSVADTYPLLVAARIITGLFGGVIASISMAIISDLFEIEQRGRAMGYLQIGLGASQLLGIPLGLFFANRLGWQSPFVMVALLSAAIVVLIIVRMRPVNGHLVSEDDRNPIAHLWQTLSRPDYRMGFLTTATLLFGGFMILPFMSSFLINNVRITNDQLPIVYIVTGVAALITMPVIGKLSDKKNKLTLFVIATAWTMAMFVVYTNLSVTPIWLVLIVNALMMMGVMSRLIPASALVSILPAPQDRGAFMSINSSVQQLAGGIAALTAGVIVKQADKFSPIMHFNTLAYISIVVSVLCIYTASRVNAIVKRGKNKERFGKMAVSAAVVLVACVFMSTPLQAQPMNISNKDLSAAAMPAAGSPSEGTNAKELFLTYAAATDPDKIVALFADDALFEVPGLSVIGLPTQFAGREAILKFMTKFHHDVFPELSFQNIVVDIETPDKVFGEFTIDGVSGVSNRMIHQRFFVYMVAENGKIKLMRVSLETIAAANALLPGGIEQALKKVP